ncbi:ester hydrolase C11orf54 homolog [Malaya genurostris]|uniref:ester hydrolase C11orf54 homolog n=1 Tax=Malaya genurostris TaxID=325434 RepID=UPI0026F3CEF6|nr:ester hydrolase C11orf54 homolog [Malaya genurostris]
MASIDTTILPFEEKRLHTPPLDEVRNVVANGLKSNFATVHVEVVDCPNLMEDPFHLAGQGLNGSPTLVELGGPPYLLPHVDYTKLYDLVSVSQRALNDTKKEFLAIGAGAGPYPLVDSNCEGMFNLRVHANGHVTSESHLARVNPDRKKAVLQKIPSSETRCALLGNIFLSEGKPGKVLKVSCKKRTGNKDFIASIRTALEQHYGERTVGMGGVFLLKKGKAKQHVMSPFSETAINTEDELNKWLNFFDMSATLIAVGTLVTNECDLDLRLQHFHSFSRHGEGGHYHIDTTPDIVEYEGYFNIGEKIVRVDKPTNTHKFGRD